MIEALCCGLPWLFQILGHSRCYCSKHNAWLVTHKTISGYTEGLTSLVHDQQLYERLKQALCNKTQTDPPILRDNARAIWEIYCSMENN